MDLFLITVENLLRIKTFNYFVSNFVETYPQFQNDLPTKELSQNKNGYHLKKSLKEKLTIKAISVETIILKINEVIQ